MKSTGMKVALFCFSLVLLTGLFFCFYATTSSKDNTIKIGACYSDMSNPYFRILNEEISSAVEGKGDILLARDSMSDQVKQNEQIHSLIEENVNALIISPVDFKDITPALKEAKAAGVPVVIVDSQVKDDELISSTVSTDNYDVGVQLANYFMNQRNSAKILLIGQENSKSSEDRLEGFKNTIAKKSQYQIVEEVLGSGEVDKTMIQVSSVIEDKVSFDCVFAVNDNIAIGSIAACDKAKLTKGISFLSTGGSPVVKKLIKNNKMMATAAQFPSETGKQAVENTYKILNGQNYKKELLVPVKLITKNTITSYDLDKWQ